MNLQDRKLDAQCSNLVRHALPVRVVSIHHYVSFGKLIELLVPFVLSMIGPSLRQRYKMYSGDAASYVAALGDHGITTDELPIDMGGTNDFDYGAWIRDELNRQRQ
jgi:hypothetical protein